MENIKKKLKNNKWVKPILLGLVCFVALLGMYMRTKTSGEPQTNHAEITQEEVEKIEKEFEEHFNDRVTKEPIMNRNEDGYVFYQSDSTYGLLIKQSALRWNEKFQDLVFRPSGTGQLTTLQISDVILPMETEQPYWRTNSILMTVNVAQLSKGDVDYKELQTHMDRLLGKALGLPDEAPIFSNDKISDEDIQLANEVLEKAKENGTIGRVEIPYRPEFGSIELRHLMTYQTIAKEEQLDEKTKEEIEHLIQRVSSGIKAGELIEGVQSLAKRHTERLENPLPLPGEEWANDWQLYAEETELRSFSGTLSTLGLEEDLVSQKEYEKTKEKMDNIYSNKERVDDDE